MLDILLLTILIYQRTFQAAAGIMFCGYSFHFSPGGIANSTVYVSQCQGSAYLLTLPFILKSHQTDPETFYNKKEFSAEASCDNSDWGDKDNHTYKHQITTKVDQQNFHVLRE